MSRPLGIILLIVMIMLVACQQESQELPTRVSIATRAPESIQQAQSTLEPPLTATPTDRFMRTGPTLPPTFTPTPQPTTLPTDPPTPTLEGFSASGTLYYIYNGDAITAITGDGTRQEQLLSFGPAKTITDLTLSPNKELFAFVAPGNGSANEVWIMNRDATYVQKVTCLGLMEVRDLAFSPDGQRIAFIAADAVDGPADVYSASWVGSNNCPEGNDQKKLLDLASENLGDVIYDTRAERLFFSDGPTQTLELTTGRTFPALTETGGVGPDFAFAFNPTDPNMLTYLQDENRLNDRTEGSLFAILPRAIDILSPQAFQFEALTRHYDWSPDGTQIVISAPNIVSVYDIERGTAPGIVLDTAFPPMAVFDPTGERIAYIDGDPANRRQQQIFVTDSNGTNQTQLTAYESGSISDMVWISGGW